MKNGSRREPLVGVSNASVFIFSVLENSFIDGLYG